MATLFGPAVRLGRGALIYKLWTDFNRCNYGATTRVCLGAELDWLYVFPSHNLSLHFPLEVSGMRWCMLDQGCCRKGGTRRHHALNKQQTPLNPVMDDGAICR